MLTLSLLEQSLVRAGGNAQETLAQTLRLAREAERLGYHRLWVSEHHDSPAIAGSSPEVLLAAIGATTHRIRIGSGGVMLPHYSPYKVAENFGVLANLYPGRVDLGVGRAPGAAMRAAIALATDGQPKFERFPQLVRTLAEALWNADFRPCVAPRAPQPLPLWLLGSSADSALLAAQLGLPYAIALFINPQYDARIATLYRRHFQPSALQPEPRILLATQVYCSDTEVHADRMARAIDLAWVRFASGRGEFELGPLATADAYEFSAEEQAFLRGHRRVRAAGTPEQVRERLLALAAEFQADEVMAVCNTWDYEDRLRCLELLVQVLPQDGPPASAPA